jgi:hypothetical protein
MSCSTALSAEACGITCLLEGLSPLRLALERMVRFGSLANLEKVGQEGSLCALKRTSLLRRLLDLEGSVHVPSGNLPAMFGLFHRLEA